MSPIQRVLLGALLACEAPSARAGVGRAVEIALPGESASFKTGSAPAITLQLSPVNGLAPMGLTPAAPSKVVRQRYVVVTSGQQNFGYSAYGDWTMLRAPEGEKYEANPQNGLILAAAPGTARPRSP